VNVDAALKELRALRCTLLDALFQLFEGIVAAGFSFVADATTVVAHDVGAVGFGAILLRLTFQGQLALQLL